MAKQREVKRISPSEAVRSMELYNEKVFMLVQQCEMALQNKLVDKIIADNMSDALKEVKSFHAEF